MHWKALTHNVWDQVFSAGNVLAMALVYPLVKAVHELGHACAVKRGGEVHEIGLMFLLLVPIPYVDASAAAGFADKRWRMLVGAAGILVELFLAALAAIAWTQLEPGLGRSVAYNVIILCGVSTLFMNGNPLLRYDAMCCRTPSRFPTWGSAPMPGSVSVQALRVGPGRRRGARASRGEQWWFVGCAAVLRLPHVHHVPGHLPGGGAVLRRPAGLLGHPEHHRHVLWRLARQLFTDPQIQARRGRFMPSPRSACWRRPDWRARCPCRPRPIPRAWSGCRRRPRCARRWPASCASARRRTMLVAGRALLALENDELQRRDAMLAAQVDEYQARYAGACPESGAGRHHAPSMAEPADREAHGR